MELEQNKDEFKKLGLGLAAISYDSVAVLHNFAERKNIQFSMLSDSDSKLVRSLDILNDTVPKDSPFHGIPYPGIFIVDGQGKITAKYFEDDYRQRFTAGDILTRQFGIVPAREKTEVQGKQLQLTATASSSIVATGQRVALVLDIELKPNMHVYAPSVEGYIPIDWKMKESDAAIVHEAAYPAPERLELKAIGEVVPAYQGKFRLTRDITIGPDAKLRPLLDAQGKFTVEGTLRYQACDDRVCYIPQDLPVKWTFQYESFDRQRAPVEMQRK